LIDNVLAHDLCILFEQTHDQPRLSLV